MEHLITQPNPEVAKTLAPDQIHGRALLVNLHVSLWEARKFDRNVTAACHSTWQAASDAGRYSKHLFGGKKNATVHAAIATCRGKARQAFHAQTLPWADGGWRLLPSANLARFSKVMREHAGEFTDAVDKFLRDYPELRDAAKESLGAMFNLDEYPDTDEVRGKFSFEIEKAPIPKEGDFRVIELPKEQLDDLERSTASKVAARTLAAMNDAWARLRERVTKVRDVMADPKAKFKDTLIEHVCELVDTLARLNVTGDKHLEAMRVRVAEELAGFTPEALRKEPETRAAAASAAERILDAMKGSYQ